MLAEELLFKPSTDSTVASAVNATATATLPAPGAGKRWMVTGIQISASAAPVAAVSAELQINTVQEMRWEIPASAFAPIIMNFKRPFRGGVDHAVDAILPALGAGVRGTIVVLGFITSE